MKIEPATPSDYPALLGVWERAVRATHDFLSEDDIVSIRAAVRDYALPMLDVYVTRDDKGAPIGFMGLAGNTVEALFVDPSSHGRGLGRAFLDHARALRGCLKVDVNEQNPRAAAFYLKYGFVQTGRSPRDSDGRPFPILHLAEPRTEKGTAE